MYKNLFVNFSLACCVATLPVNSYFSFDSTIEENSPIPSFVYHPLVPYDIWKKLNPYFLPNDHPIKMQLDRLFGQIRATQSEENFVRAGFDKPKMRKPTNIVIGRHPQFKKYIFKVYLDTQPSLDEWVCWIHRIDGACAIQACLERHSFKHFCVPKKWIYPLPPEPSPPENPCFHRKNFILVVENMNILPSQSNLKAFKTKMSPQILQELYTILTEEGLIDSVYPDNIPFTKSGKIAFIDTEHRYPGISVRYDKLTPFLSKEMQEYWHSLIERKD